MSRHAQLFDLSVDDDPFPNLNHGDLFFESRSSHALKAYGFYHVEHATRLSREKLFPDAYRNKVFIPRALTACHANAIAYYSDALRQLMTLFDAVYVFLHPLDDWFLAKHCNHLSIADREKVARWHSVCFRFTDFADENKWSGTFYDTNFDNEFVESLRSTTWYEAHCRGRPLNSNPWTVDDSLNGYSILWKTWKIVYVIIKSEDSFRQPSPAPEERVNFFESLSLSTENSTLMAGDLKCCYPNFSRSIFDNNGRFNNLLPDWSLWKHRATKNRKREYQFFALAGPVEHYNKSRILAQIYHMHAGTPGAYGAVEPFCKIVEHDEETHPMRMFAVLGPLRQRLEVTSMDFVYQLMWRRDSFFVGAHPNGQWRSMHAFILDRALIFADLSLPAYVQMWILNFLHVMHAPDAVKINLIQSVVASVRNVLAVRREIAKIKR